jgi:hypothetical protein
METLFELGGGLKGEACTFSMANPLVLIYKYPVKPLKSAPFLGLKKMVKVVSTPVIVVSLKEKK